MSDPNALGAYLKNRRQKLDAAALGLPANRRRTPGLRREEVAQRANISTTWYTWLEQGRGGAASASVLNRIAQALNLTDVEREHLFLLGLGRQPEVRFRTAEPITPRLQRLLDTLTHSPAVLRTATWDVVAWNRPATAVFTDYAKLEPRQRNILRLIFSDRRVRSVQTDWQAVARFVVGAFRIDAARAGADAEIQSLVDELSESSPEFAAMWNENHVQTHGDGIKYLRHPQTGTIALEYSAFAVDGRPDLSLIVYNPLTEADRTKIETLMQAL